MGVPFGYEGAYGLVHLPVPLSHPAPRVHGTRGPCGGNPKQGSGVSVSLTLTWLNPYLSLVKIWFKKRFTFDY